MGSTQTLSQYVVLVPFSASHPRQRQTGCKVRTQSHGSAKGGSPGYRTGTTNFVDCHINSGPTMKNLCSHSAHAVKQLAGVLSPVHAEAASWQKGEAFLESLRLDPLPILSPCYCGTCKKPLPNMSVVDEHHAWCDACDSIVRTSWTQVPGWTVGVLVCLVATNWLLS